MPRAYERVCDDGADDFEAECCADMRLPGVVDDIEQWRRLKSNRLSLCHMLLDHPCVAAMCVSRRMYMSEFMCECARKHLSLSLSLSLPLSVFLRVHTHVYVSCTRTCMCLDACLHVCVRACVRACVCVRVQIKSVARCWR